MENLRRVHISCHVVNEQSSCEMSFQRTLIHEFTCSDIQGFAVVVRQEFSLINDLEKREQVVACEHVEELVDSQQAVSFDNDIGAECEGCSSRCSSDSPV